MRRDGLSAELREQFERSARAVAAAISVIQMDDVFDARIAPACTFSSSSLKTLRLTSRFSTIASTTSSCRCCTGAAIAP